MVIVKICGITTVDDARFAFDAGADWIGLNLLAGPRRIGLTTANNILGAIDEPSRAVALLAAKGGHLPTKCLDSLRKRGVERVQVYGDAIAEAVAGLLGLGFQPIVAAHIDGGAALDRLDTVLAQCGENRPAYVLLDSGGPGLAGGTGRSADWVAIGRARSDGGLEDWPPILLAGGLRPENVTDAIRATRPAGVDVSSGVESAPGRKDPAKVRAFLAAARNAASQMTQR